MGQTGLAEMNLVVDQAGEDVFAGGIDDVIRVGRGRRIKIKEPTVFNQNVLLGHAIRANTVATTNQESGHT